MVDKRLITDEERKRLLALAGLEDDPSQVASLLQQIGQLNEMISALQEVGPAPQSKDESPPR